MGGRSKSTAPRCVRCRMHVERCVCSELPRLETTARLALVMHCREVPKTTATGPLALACLPNSRLFVHGERDTRVDLNPLFEEGRRVLLLYPSEDARPLDEIRRDGDARPVTLIVPDGNWRQAARAAKRIPGAERAERVTLPAGAPTEWGLRLETKEGGLATFEAIARAFGYLEGEEVERELMRVFRHVVQETWDARGGPLSGEARVAEHRVSGTPVFDVLYEDGDLVAIGKPSGAIVHRGWASDGVPLLQAVRDRVGVYVHPVHRLDRATSGVLLFAKDAETARALGDQFSGRSVEKVYLALTRGSDPELGRVDHPLESGASRERKKAVTDFRFLGASGRYGLYEAQPLTGRLHQIRRHLKHVSHPIIGDVRYGKGEHNRLFRESYDFHRLALHARRLRFRHPRTSEELTIEAPLPQDFLTLLARLGLDALL